MSGTERVRVLERFQRLWKTVPSWGSNVVKALRLRPTRSAVQNTNSKGDRTYCIVSSFILDGITLWLIFPFSQIAFGVYLKSSTKSLLLTDSCKLSHTSCLLLGSALLWRGTSGWIQALSSCSREKMKLTCVRNWLQLYICGHVYK